MKNLLNKAGILSLIILAISFLGCEDDDDANGLPEVVAAFTQTQIENSGVVSFINISENADSFMWDFGDGTTSSEMDPVKTFAEGSFTVTLTASNAAGASNTFSDELTINLPDPPPPFDSGLLANGDFEDGGAPWFTNFGDNMPEIREAGGNNFFFANVETADPMQPFLVNLSQVVEITQGTNYILTFDASSDQARTILAGIGLNEAPFSSSSPEVTLTTTTQTFTLQLTAGDFGGANSRVLFDMAGAEGTVVIDNVSLVEGGDGSDSDTGGSGGGGSLVECSGGTLINDFETDDDSIFSNFGGGVGTIIDNPDTSVNTSARVGQYVKNEDQVFGGITIALDSNIDLNNGVFSIDVNSQAVRQLLFKLEGIDVELTAATSGTGWETIEYDFDGNVGEVTGITLIMDNGTLGDGSADFTILFDNIRLCSNDTTGGGGGLVECSGGTLINDFETDDDSIFNNFGGGVGTIIDNPDTSVNTSAKVGQYVKNADQLFGGITIALDSNIDLNNGVFSIDVSSQAVRQLLFKLEGIDVELTTATSGTGWETIEYDFDGNVGEVTGITLIMDNGTLGDGSADFTIQFDNIRLCSNDSSGGGGGGSACTTGSAPTGPASTLPVTFEDCVGFDSTFGGVTAVLEDNPSASGINTSATVLRVDKPTTADFFGGFQNSAGFDTGQFNGDPITVTFQVYSNLNDITFRCELGTSPVPNPDLGNPAPQFATLGSNAANTWVELSVTFTPNPGAETDYYNYFVIKPDDNQDDPNGSETDPPAADGIYYIDNIRVE
ncbi:MAG: PKD domain-containing protein [Bacteroidota bacterium]